MHEILVIGTVDPHHNPTFLAEPKAITKGQSLVIDGANHSLEIEGDLKQSIKAI